MFMRSTHLIASLLIGAFAVAPVAVFAEETVATDPSTGAPVPTLYQEAPRNPTPAMMRAQKAATGTRMMASGTRPIPKAIENRMETRDDRMEQLRANCTLPDGTVASRTDCATFRQGERQERREEVRERIVERKGEALRALANVMLKRLTATVERQTKIADRIDARIVKLKTQGIVTTDAEAQIAIARTKIAEAQTAVTAAKAQIEAAVTSANASASSTVIKDAGKAVREEMQKAREALLASHKALVEALNALKANKKATTTPETATAGVQ